MIVQADLPQGFGLGVLGKEAGKLGRHLGVPLAGVMGMHPQGSVQEGILVGQGQGGQEIRRGAGHLHHPFHPGGGQALQQGVPVGIEAAVQVVGMAFKDGHGSKLLFQGPGK